jgi:hypothetical protein
MPFASKAQMRYLFAKKPEIAKEFAKEQKKQGKSFKGLPEKKGKFNRLNKYLSTKEK